MPLLLQNRKIDRVSTTSELFSNHPHLQVTLTVTLTVIAHSLTFCEANVNITQKVDLLASKITVPWHLLESS